MSANRTTIEEAISTFDFSDYGFDDAEESKGDPDTRVWIYDLAAAIDIAIKDRIEKWIKEETK